MQFLTDRPARQRSLALLAAACVALGAQAGTVEAPVKLLQPEGGVSAPPVSTLERALTIDTNTSQRNLDLLLEARRAGETASPMRAGGLPAQPAALPAGLSRGTLVPLGLQAQDSVTAPGAAERRDWQGAVPGRGQAGLPGGQPGMGGPGADAADPGQGLSGRGAGSAEPGRIAEALDNLRDFVRDNRFALLAGAVLLMLTGAGVQALARRR
ncbi:MAG: hypothetical protein QE285_20255 [Aquabacterium sp.]|nr:hypothetical protein [Aquabacterium sp.]